VAVETGQLTNFNEIQEEIRALSGYATELAKISPEQANGLLGNINAGGRALLAKSADVITKAYGAEVDLSTDATIDNTAMNLKVMYDEADSVQTMDDYTNNARAIVFASASNNPSTRTAKMEAFEKANIMARDASLIRYFSSPDFADNPYDAIQKLRTNDGGLRSDLWGRLPEDQRQKVIDKLLSRQAEDLQAIERATKLKEEVSAADNITDYDQYYLGEISGDELLARFIDRGYVPGREELRAIREGDHSGANQQTIGILEDQARKGRLSAKDVDRRAARREISWKQANNIKSIINGSGSQDLRTAKELVANAFVPNPLDPTTRTSHERRAQVESQLLLAERRARIAGKPFDAVAEAQRLIGSRKQQEDVKQLEALQGQLKRILEKNNIEYREDITIEDLKRAGVDNVRTLDQIRRTLEAIRELK
jgi:hypothetical protein